MYQKVIICLQFNSKLDKMGKKILNIYGDTFSGKTHLAKIFQNKSKALYLTNNDVNEEIFIKSN